MVTRALGTMHLRSHNRERFRSLYKSACRLYTWRWVGHVWAGRVPLEVGGASVSPTSIYRAVVGSRIEKTRCLLSLNQSEDNMSTSDSPNKRAVLKLKAEEGNDVCADCGRKGESYKGQCIRRCGSSSPPSSRRGAL